MKRCRQCKARFEPTRPMQTVCSPGCGLALARTKAGERLRKAAWRRERASVRVTRATLLARAQSAFNRFIRARDAGLPCISCGAMPENKPGGTMDAGHYRSTGSAPHLRFEERNCHAQCVKCNQHLSGNVVEYRLGLIQRYGSELVEWLEGPHESHRWTFDELKGIEREYNEKARRVAKGTLPRSTISPPEVNRDD